MKTWMRKTLALALAAAMLCGSVVGVSAAEEEYYNRIKADSVVVSEGYTLKLLNSAGTEVAAVADTVDEQTVQVHKNVVKLQLTITAPKSGQEYVVLLLSGGEQVPTSTNIRYIDQDDVATFTIYPDQMSQVDEYSVVVSSVDGKATVATFEVLEPPYVWGRVNDDEAIDGFDALLALQHFAGLTQLSKQQQLAANVNGDQAVDGFDALLMLQHFAGLIEKFPVEG